MYGVHINKNALKCVNSLTEKSERLIKRKLELLKEDPYPGRDDNPLDLTLPIEPLKSFSLSVLSTDYK